MTDKQIEFDRASFLKDLQASIALIDQAEKIGAALASDDVEQLFLVGCGAPHYMFETIAYWANQRTKAVKVESLYPAQFLNLENKHNDKTVVIFGSHSGTTKETVNAAAKSRSTYKTNITVTQHSDSPLADQTQQVIHYGKTKQGYFSSYILAQMLVSAFLQRSTQEWQIHEKLKASLFHLPAALADAKEKTIDIGILNAKALQNESALYVVGNGPMYTTAYVFAACFLMEMQHINAHPIHALDFFHGPFEIIADNTPLILLLGEGINRPDSERVKSFCDQYTKQSITYDAQNFEMPGIHPDIRPMVAPFIVDVAMTNLVDQLAILRNHPLDTRRYMGKVEY